ncbi:hypothetical protein [Streptomyces rhizosphaerihabitans]|uniref:hypothetical protein n=1 Tax=Streptomyces rhizosphaerihabitans TaxID=1266770 RepID=UPI0021BFA24D|nr:hypothetical protein [Streptomyces rhizosphaerihabitans]MCT9011670.1 hypothetical protein [Streptomyces rhizosphaerihabitans]
MSPRREAGEQAPPSGAWAEVPIGLRLEVLPPCHQDRGRPLFEVLQVLAHLVPLLGPGRGGESRPQGDDGGDPVGEDIRTAEWIEWRGSGPEAWDH